jgi:hypothetical protein
MAFELIDYEVLKKSLNESIKTLILHHYPQRTVDTSKLKESVVLLDGERRTHAEFLLTIIDLTDLMDVSTPEAVQKQARVLNTAAFYVHQKIESTYSNSYFSSVLSPDRSNLFASLTSSLKLTPETMPKSNALLDMYKDLKALLCRYVYKQGDSRYGYLDIQVFADIYNYRVRKDIEDLTNKITKIELELGKKAEKLHVKAERPPKNNGLWGMFFGSAPTNTSALPSSDKLKNALVDDYEVGGLKLQ